MKRDIRLREALVGPDDATAYDHQERRRRVELLAAMVDWEAVERDERIHAEEKKYRRPRPAIVGSGR
jgi:hypothetical protein